MLPRLDDLANHNHGGSRLHVAPVLRRRLFRSYRPTSEPEGVPVTFLSRDSFDPEIAAGSDDDSLRSTPKVEVECVDQDCPFTYAEGGKAGSEGRRVGKGITP